MVNRALRSQKVDLQRAGAGRYGEEFCRVPAKMEVKTPGHNIDHRRCLSGTPSLPATINTPTSKNPSDYQAGDIVSATG
ncbi:DUF1287 domain-containing protein [Shigella flexneri]